MAISEFQREHVAKRLADYCERRVPPDVRDQVRLEFRIGPRDVELFEVRPQFDNPAAWLEHPVAKFRWVASHREWRLYCQFRDLRWHEYEPRFAAGDFDTLLAEVDRDPTCIFWG